MLRRTSSRGGQVVVDPIRMLRRWRSFQADVAEEVNFLLEQHGAAALTAAQTRLSQASLKPYAKRVLEAAVKQLRR